MRDPETLAMKLFWLLVSACIVVTLITSTAILVGIAVGIWKGAL